MEERLIQSKPEVVATAVARFKEWGAKNLIKVRNLGPVVEEVDGYFGFIQSIAGLTPAGISRMFGLRETDLIQGAMVYRFNRLPLGNEFEVRGYSTLPDGRVLDPALKTDTAGYRRGTGGLQYVLTKPMPVTYLGFLRPQEEFDIRTIKP
jgi:hypothetical protein